ncbi:MAG: rRNA maturation RNase YbeY [Cyclobacteriaceae bacterium]
MSNILFHFEDVPSFEIDSSATENWLTQVVNQEQKSWTIDELNYIFCSDEYLLQINQQYLNHDYYTDVITFDNSGSQEEIVGDIFISTDRVKENAQALNSSFHIELYRIMVHGLLHLLEYDDKSPEAKKLMTNKEDTYLSLLSKFNVPRGTN